MDGRKAIKNIRNINSVGGFNNPSSQAAFKQKINRIFSKNNTGMAQRITGQNALRLQNVSALTSDKNHHKLHNNMSQSNSH